jgi:hypothetical protein
MKLHRAITLVALILLSVVLLGVMAGYGAATFDVRSLVALLVVVGAAAVAGLAFSYRRYFPRRR